MNLLKGGLVTAAVLGLVGVVAVPAEAAPHRPARAGDVNGDGRADVIAGVPYSKVKGKTDAGGVAVFFGGKKKVSAPHIAAMGKPAKGENLAKGIVTGDFNRDGYADVLATAKKRIVAFYGSKSGLRRPQGFTWPAAFPSIAAGDFNADGYGDVAAYASGRVVILKGGKKGLRIGQKITTESPAFGVILASGDVNGDGITDLVGSNERATANDPVQDHRFTLLFGAKKGLGHRRDVVTHGETRTRYLTLGDVNGDGRADLVRTTSRDGENFQVAYQTALGGPITWLPADQDEYPSNVTVGNGLVAIHIEHISGNHDWVDLYRAGKLVRSLSHRNYETGYGTSLRFANVLGDARSELIVGLPGVYGIGELELLPGANTPGSRLLSFRKSAGLGVSQP